jgi:hypothetical protein
MSPHIALALTSGHSLFSTSTTYMMALVDMIEQVTPLLAQLWTSMDIRAFFSAALIITTLKYRVRLCHDPS